MINYSFSIITPTHSPKNIPFLLELYDSLKEQTYSNWEWVLLLNGDFFNFLVPPKILNDSQVKVFRTNSENNNIGLVKNLAFGQAINDILVEVDHDDILTDNCLLELNLAFQDQSVGFVYSDDAILHHQNNFIPYDPAYGWTYRNFHWKNKDLISMNSFEPSSQSLSFIWFAPDHVRAWRKEIYNSIGGHNKSLSICDDHDIMIRTYLHTKFFKINKPLYIYRITGDNTSIDHKNAEIQIETRKIFNEYAVALAEKDAKEKNLLMIDLGGGINAKPGYTTIDLEDADIIADLNNGIPLPDNSVGIINASHVLEHLRDPIKSMKEIHRVLVHGGWAFIEVPSTDGRGAFQDPTHVSYWNENSFLYYTEKNMARFIRNTDIRFSKFRCETLFPNDWMKSINASVVVAWLCCIKDDSKRFPGIWNI